VTALAKYDEACRAIEAAKSVDEAKAIADKAVAIKAYARQAKNRDLEIDAAEIRLRAQRRLGEILVEKKLHGEIRAGHPVSNSTGLKLSELGIDRKLSSRAQRLAATPRSSFDRLLREWRSRMHRGNDRIVDPVAENGAARGRARNCNQPLDRLVAGKRLGDLRMVSLSSVIARLEDDLALLKALERRFGTQDVSVFVRDAISASQIDEIIAEVQGRG
jgi:hypothetical protein